MLLSSGCKEGILVDLSEPTVESPVRVTDSIELLREDPLGWVDDVAVASSQLTVVHSLLDIQVEEKNLSQPSPFRLIEEETFDFDLPVTPVNSDKSTSGPDEEEEVFFGPVGFHERCVSTVIDSVKKETKPLSPLNSRQMAEICKEANLMAARISSAASTMKSKNVPKENLIIAKKQLKLDKNVFSEKAVGSLLNSVRKIRTSDEDDNKENCDNGNNMEVDGNDDTESLKTLEAFLKNEEVDVRRDAKTSSSESEGCESPSKRHNRSGTYTVDKTPHELLPAEKRRSLPVVGKETEKSSSLKVSGDQEEKFRCQSKLQKPASKLMKPSIAVHKPEIKEPVLDSSAASKPQSKLSVPKPSSLLPSKLKPVTLTSSVTSSSATDIPTKPAQPIPQKSAIPGLKGRIGAPASKLQLMKPGGLQRSASVRAKSTSESTAKSGPLKAFTPAFQSGNEADEPATPTKEEKKVQRKNLSSSFSTPSKTGSTSSMESPASSLSMRRSCLPTPTKSRLSSTCSMPSPCGSRTSSTSSMKSVDSPLVKGSASSTRSSSKVKDLNLDGSSPSSMKLGKPAVTNTPNLPKKKLSPWSPVVKKKPHDLVDQAIMCTKKIRR